MAFTLRTAEHLHLNRRDAEGFEPAIGYFNQSLERNPDFALAYAGLSDCYTLLSFAGVTPEASAKARTAALKAVALDDSSADPHTSLAGIDVFEWNWPDAEKEFQRALALNPNYALAHHFGNRSARVRVIPVCEDDLKDVWMFDQYRRDADELKAVERAAASKAAVPRLRCWDRRTHEPDPGDGFEAVGILPAGGVLSSRVAWGGTGDVEDARGPERAGTN